MNEQKTTMAQQFARIVQAGLYEEADEMLSELRKTTAPSDYLSEDLCSTAAFLYERLGRREEELYYLQQGLVINGDSPATV